MLNNSLSVESLAMFLVLLYNPGKRGYASKLLQGYQKKNIWNLDETGAFWKALPERGF